ncbi:MAG: ABC transporter permease [Mycobacteriales bacterium]
MSAVAAPSPPSVSGRRVPITPVNQTSVIHSEWIKFTTLRSTWISLAVAVIGTIGVGALASWAIDQHWSHLSAGDRQAFSPITQSLTGVYLAQLVIGVLGVLVISGEYATGMIRATLTASPRRLQVLWSKLLVFVSVDLLLMVAAAFGAFFVGQTLLHSHGTTLAAPDALRSVFGVGLYLAVVGVLAVSIGFVVRSTAGGISGVVGLLIVLPAIAHVLPASWQRDYVRFLPSNAGGALYTIHPDPGTLSPWTGFAVMCLWALVALVTAAILLRRRDA